MTAKAAAPTSKPVGNVKTEVIIGTAAGKLSSAVKSFLDASAEIGKLPEHAEELALIIVSREEKLSLLEQELKNRIAQNRIDLQQAFDADQSSFINHWLEKNGKVAVLISDYEGLQESLQKMQKDHEADIKAAEGKAFGIANADKVNALKIAQLEHEKKEASNIAEIAHLKSQTANLQAQVDMLIKQVDEQRKASVEISKAGAVGTINVGAEGQRR